MKISDLDVLQQAKDEFLSACGQYCDYRDKELRIMIGSVTIHNNTAISATRTTLMYIADQRVENAKAKLVMLGVSDFQDKDPRPPKENT